jgi:nitrate reductase gamma subunit
MENTVSHALAILEEPVQYVALSFMALMYAIKIRGLLKKPFPAEKAELKGDRVSGALLSLTNVLRPWDMESTSKHLYFYTEFIIFHVAVALTIGSTFFIPLTPWLMTPTVSAVIMVFMGLAFLIGLRRIYRRLTVPEIKIISSPDDYFAIILMTVFFAVGFVTMYLWIQGKPETGFMWIFFLMTTFFLLYVPFSKISHYVLYPFGRVNYGMIFGGRGVLNKSKKDITWDPKIS